MNEWCKSYTFKRKWTETKEFLGIIKHHYPDLPFVAALVILYRVEVESFINYGHIRSFEHFYVDGDDISKEEFTETINYLANKIPLPFDVSEQISYQEIKSITLENSWLTSVSDRQTITGIDISDIVDISISTISS